MADIVNIQKQCIQCHSTDVKPYGARWYCLNCGFTFHRDSADVRDELINRQLSVMKE